MTSGTCGATDDGANDRDESPVERFRIRCESRSRHAAGRNQANHAGLQDRKISATRALQALARFTLPTALSLALPA